MLSKVISNSFGKHLVKKNENILKPEGVVIILIKSPFFGPTLYIIMKLLNFSLYSPVESYVWCTFSLRSLIVVPPDIDIYRLLKLSNLHLICFLLNFCFISYRWYLFCWWYSWKKILLTKPPAIIILKFSQPFDVCWKKNTLFDGIKNSCETCFSGKRLLFWQFEQNYSIHPLRWCPDV